MGGSRINLRCGMVVSCIVSQLGHGQYSQMLGIVGCEYEGMEGDGIGVGDELGASDGTKPCRHGANLRSLILPKTDAFRPRFLEFDSMMISASCFSLGGS